MISLVGIAAGFGMLAGLLSGRLFRRWTEGFLVATTATSVTGFLFPFRGVTPGIVVGVRRASSRCVKAVPRDSVTRRTN